MYITKTELKLYFNKQLLLCAVVLALLSLTAGLLGEELLYKDKLFPKLILYVSDNDRSPESAMLLDSLTTYKEGYLEVKRADDRTALAAVETGEAAAALIVPESFFADIMSGKNSDASVYVNAENRASAEIVTLAAKSLKEQLAAAQSGIYYVLQTAQDIEAYNKYFNEINFAFLSVFMGRSIESETVTALGSVSNKDYFAFCFYAFMMFLTSCLLIESGNIIKRGGAASLLAVRGTRLPKLFFYKFLSVFFVYLALNILLFAFMLSTGMFGGISALGIMALTALSSLVQSAFCVLFIWLFNDVRSAGVTIFISQLACLFFSGGLLPLVFLPDALRKLCYLTPNYYLTSLFISLRTGKADMAGVVGVLFMSAAAMAIACSSAYRQSKNGGSV